MKLDYNPKRVTRLKGSIDRYHLHRDGELPGEIRTLEKQQERKLQKCERCPAFTRGKYCKPCSEDIRIENARNYNKSFN